MLYLLRHGESKRQISKHSSGTYQIPEIGAAVALDVNETNATLLHHVCSANRESLVHDLCVIQLDPANRSQGT